LENLRIKWIEWSIRLKHALVDRDFVIGFKIIATLRISISTLAAIVVAVVIFLLLFV